MTARRRRREQDVKAPIAAAASRPSDMIGVMQNTAPGR
jgi:hypothetical protein